MQPVPGLEPQTLTQPSGLIQDPVLNTLPFVVLLLPLFGFIVLSLFGDWIRDQERQARAEGRKGLVAWTQVNGTSLAMLAACTLVVGAFVFAALSVRRLL